MSTTAAVTTAAKGLKKYRRNWKLVRSKLLEYIPVMIITNLSVFLISSVDGVIAGNFVGKEAFSAINIFFPISVFTGAFSVIASYGISTSLSTAMGRNNTEEIAKIKNASIYIAIGMAIVAGIVQIPIAFLIIRSYGLSPEMYDTTWKYGIACMLCTPFSMISCVGTLKLQIAGKMKALMVLTITEGLSNTAFDLLFVAVFQMGVAGTGFGTLCANLIRCTSTIIYLRKKTDFYKREKERPDPGLIKNILLCGIPDASVPVVSAFQNYFMLRILMNIFGMNGSVINGTTGFCFNFAYVLILGIQAGIRPLMGLFVGAKDFDAIRELIRQGAKYVFMILGTVTILFALFPGLVFKLHGIKDIPESGETCIRIFAIFFIIQGLNFLLRLYLSNRKDIRFTTAMTLGGNALLPLFAFLISLAAPGPLVYLSYTITEALLFLLSILRCRKLMASEESYDTAATVLYMTLRQQDAVEASRELRRFAKEIGTENKITYRTAVCLEEMAAYVKSADDLSAEEDRTTSIEITVRFQDSCNAVLAILDNGKCIALDKDSRKEALITDNYNFVKNIANQVTYQYLLNLNYTTLSFQAK